MMVHVCALECIQVLGYLRITLQATFVSNVQWLIRAISFCHFQSESPNMMYISSLADPWIVSFFLHLVTRVLILMSQLISVVARTLQFMPQRGGSGLVD